MKFSNLRVLVTDGAGSKSANLASRLLKEGAKMTVFEDFSPISSENPKYYFERAHARVCRLLREVIKTENGFRPKVDLRTGLAQIVGWNKSSNLQERRDAPCE